MKLIYKAKWIIVILSAITFVASFVVLFIGGTVDVNRCLLGADILLITAQLVNMIYAFRYKHDNVGVALFVCLLVSLGLMWATYIWSWNYTVKAMTIGFE